MSGTGTATLSFGAAPGSNVATITITGQTDIGATDFAEGKRFVGNRIVNTINSPVDPSKENA